MGYYMAEADNEAKCAIHASKAACTAAAADGCELQTLGENFRCKTTNLAKVESIKELCADNGAATYATAAAAATPSGADVAAPLMVVLSTLVAALAIFA